mgnify:CR=1 FL=1
MKQEIKNRFNDLKISRKMILVYFCFASVFFLIAFVSLQISFNIYAEKLYEKSLQELDFFAQKVNDGLNEVESKSYNLALDTAVQENLQQMLKETQWSYEYNQRLYKMRSILLNELDPLSSVQSIIYVDTYGAKQEVGTSAWTVPQESMDTFLDMAEEAQGGFVTYGPTEDCPYLIAGRRIRNRLDMSLKDMGTIVLICNINDIITKNKNKLESPQAAVIVYSEDGIIYQDETSENVTLPKYREQAGYEIKTYHGRKYYMCYLHSEETDWMYVNYFPYSDIYGQVQTMRYLLFGCFAAVFVLLVLCMNRVAKIITEPLEHLTLSMQIVEDGNFQQAKEVLPQSDRRDEIGILARDFRVMVERVDELIRENYEKQLLLQDTKYKMLRAQINPHFLYNTLNVINWMVKAGRNQEAGKMIVELGAILHYSFAQDPYATIQEELDMVKSFVAIQKTRYQGRIDFEVTAEGELGRYYTPRMVLQPLVENAISYGAEPYLEKCGITVEVRENADKIAMIVQDTGAGMSAEELEAVRRSDYIPKGHGIGLKNIRERLAMDDNRSVFIINSEIGRGTRVEIYIPKRTEVGKNV